MVDDYATSQLAEAQFRAVFDLSSDAILLVSTDDRRILDANPVASRIFGYTRDELVGMRTADLVHSESRAAYMSRAGQQHNPLPFVGRRKDGSRIDIEVFARDLLPAASATRLSVVREITDRERAFDLLESRVTERTRELSALLDISRAMTGTQELQPLLALVLDRLGAVVEYTEALIMLVEGEDLCVVDYRGRLPRDAITQLRFPARWAPVFQRVLRDRGAVIVDDLLGDSDIARAYQAVEFRAIDRRVPDVRSTLSVPLTIKDAVVGQLRLDHAQPGFYTPAQADLALAVANQASMAIEQARLFASERLARERLEVAVAAGRMGTWEWDMRSQAVTWSTQLEAIHGLAPGTFGGTLEAYLSDIHPEDRVHVQDTIARSVREDDHHLEYRIVWPDGSLHWLEASGKAIRDSQGAPIGMRGVCQDITVRKAQEAERAQLHERERAASEARAALEERQRLARELHDSVSQALYGIALGAQTALGALREDRDVDAAADATEYVHKLAEASIVEMRALIFELRPESLAQEGLVVALERHAAAVRARHGLAVDVHFGTEPEVSLAVKEALYRIAQEALQNTIKHAHAQRVQLVLGSVDGSVSLEVLDDGIGFNPSAAYPGHLGLTSMRERAAAIGARLSITSTPGQGTHLRALLNS